MSRLRWTTRIALAAALVVILAVAATASAPNPNSLPWTDAASAEELVGGRKYYLCMLGQALKIGGLVLVRPDVVLVGAIVGGLACGLGW
ncbi:MAG TPA: hypothetical protein VKU85_04125 [bacterium]|nr:hypothetical protein [bacterium]